MLRLPYNTCLSCRDFFMKLRCAILDDYQQIALNIVDWSHLSNVIDITSFNLHFSNDDDLIEAVYDKEIIMLMRERTPFSRAIFERLPNLKLLITSGSRNAAIDLQAAREYGVIVCGTASHKVPPMELTWGLILSLARNIPHENQSIKTNGPWQSTIGTTLHGKQLGLLGLGKIGSLMVPIAKAFGMNVSAWSQNLTAEKAAQTGVILAGSKEELLKTSDFVSVHLILSDRTRNLLDTHDLKQMKSTSYLINTSRAQIVSRAALIQALQENWIAGAGLDVFDVEPLPQNDILRTLPNVIATPHLGYVTEENYRLFYGEAIENIQAFLRNQPIRLITG